MVSGDLVAEHRQYACIDNIDDWLGLLLHAFEIGRILNVGRAHVPAIGFAFHGFDLAPVGVALEHVGVAFLEDRRGHELLHQRVDLFGGRPDVLQVNRLAVLAIAERFDREILGHRSGQRIGHHQRRRREVIGLHVRADAAFEIAVTRQHGGGNDAVVVNRSRNLFRQRAGIADAGRASKAHQIEADLVEIELQTGVGEILRDHLTARCQRGLHPRLCGEAFGGGVTRQQSRPDQHARIGSVGA